MTVCTWGVDSLRTVTVSCRARAWPPCEPFWTLCQPVSLYRMGVRTAQHVSVPLGGSGMQFSQIAWAGQCLTSPVLLNLVWSVAEYLRGRAWCQELAQSRMRPRAPRVTQQQKPASIHDRLASSQAHMHSGDRKPCGRRPCRHVQPVQLLGQSEPAYRGCVLAAPLPVPGSTAKTASQKQTGRRSAHERQVLSGRPNLDMYLKTSMGSPAAHSSLIRTYSNIYDISLVAH